MDIIQLANYISVEYLDSKTVKEVKFTDNALEAILIFKDNSRITVNGLLASRLIQTKGNDMKIPTQTLLTTIGKGRRIRVLEEYSKELELKQGIADRRIKALQKTVDDYESLAKEYEATIKEYSKLLYDNDIEIE